MVKFGEYYIISNIALLSMKHRLNLYFSRYFPQNIYSFSFNSTE